MVDGQINYIDFKGSIGREINNIHLGVIFTLPQIKDLVFCIPLTSPKLKHFKTEKDFNDRNYRNVKHFNLQYLKQTDSIALLDQIKIISTLRVLKLLINQDNEQVILNAQTLKILKLKIYKYIDVIFAERKYIIREVK